MIGIDWGTTSLRAYRLQGRTIIDRRQSQSGITTIPAGAFPETLRTLIADWLADGETHILMAGMVGSRQGWVEAPYLPCPADPAALAAALVEIPFGDLHLAIVPGLTHRDVAGIPEVMRGEETQLAGATTRDALFCLPGTHSKWATVERGIVTGFTTAMTGEIFAALRHHTILGRMMADGPPDDEAFRRGIARARSEGGLLHHLFGIRTLGLFGELTETAAPAYLSGLLIGTEIAAIAPTQEVHLIGDPALCRLYALALAEFGLTSQLEPPDLAASGLALIAEHAGWH